jgi:hypothetical protein
LAKKLASSKGLLKLGISGIGTLEDPGIMQSLIGDRYDSLRLNSINWSDNPSYTEKSVKVLTDNILVNCHSFVFNGSLG